MTTSSQTCVLEELEMEPPDSLNTPESEGRAYVNPTYFVFILSISLQDGEVFCPSLPSSLK